MSSHRGVKRRDAILSHPHLQSSLGLQCGECIERGGKNRNRQVMIGWEEV